MARKWNMKHSFNLSYHFLAKSNGCDIDINISEFEESSTNKFEDYSRHIQYNESSCFFLNSWPEINTKCIVIDIITLQGNPRNQQAFQLNKKKKDMWYNCRFYETYFLWEVLFLDMWYNNECIIWKSRLYRYR